jgi:hypothetical protein
VHRTGLFSERTAWIGRLTPLGRFVRTETAGAALLIAAVLAALVWANEVVRIVVELRAAIL